MSKVDLLTPEIRAELTKTLGDRRLNGSAHAELLTDDTGSPSIGLTFGCTDGSTISAVIDSGPAIEAMRAMTMRAVIDPDELH